MGQCRPGGYCILSISGTDQLGKALWQQRETLHVFPHFSAVHTIAVIEN